MAEESNYMSAEEAREQWSKTHGLPVEMAPKSPEGTREYAEYSTELAAELRKFGHGE